MDDARVKRGSHELFVHVDGAGPDLLFAHGLSGTHADLGWTSGLGCRLIAPDLRGRRASSPVPNVEEHSFEEHAADILAVLDHLEIETTIVGGTSFGAAVAVAFALRHPARVRALILLASAFGAKHDEMGEGDLERYGVLADRMRRDGVAQVAKQEAARAGSERPLQRWGQHDAASVIAFLGAVPLYRPFDRVTELEALQMPTLVVPGRDEIHTQALSDAYTRALPDATLADGDAPLGETIRTFAPEGRP